MSGNKEIFVYLAEMNRQMINRLVSAQGKQMGITIVSVSKKGQKKRANEKNCASYHTVVRTAIISLAPERAMNSRICILARK
jgi:predicted aldo/keto reductase-like oxidoreductase